MQEPLSIPENKFRVFYDHEAGHYRVIVDDIDLTMHVGYGGIKVDFAPMAVDEVGVPEVTLTFPATGGLEVVLQDGTVVDGGSESAA